MKRKLIALMLACLMLIGVLAGCATDTKTDDSSSSSSSTSASTDDKKTETKTEDKKEEEASLPEGKKLIKTSKGEFTFNEEGYPVTDEQSTFSILVATQVEDIATSHMMKEISETTNVYPEWQVVAKTGVDERKALLWASNDYPDVIGAGMLNKNDINTYGPGGILLPLNDYYKYLTYFDELAPKHLLGEMTCFDGNIYYIPTVYDTERYDGLMHMPKVWLEQLGLEVPKTVDDFYNCLVAIRDGDPNGNGIQDEIPFAIGLWSSPFDYLASFFCAFGAPGDYYVEDDGTVVDGRLSEDVKEGIKFLQKCYNEGLLDKELFTQDLSAFRAKGSTELPTYGFMKGYSISYYVGETHFANDLYDVMPLLADSEGNKGWMFSNSSAQATITSMALSVSCECPEIVMRWANCIQEPLNSLQIDDGPIGIRYEYDANGNLQKIEEPVVDGYDSFQSWRESNNEQQFPRLQNNIVKDYLYENYGFSYEYSESRKELEAGVDEYYKYMIQEFPIVSPTQEQQEEINMYEADLKKYYEETVAGWITSTADIDAEWDNYVASMKQFGADRVVEIKQEQADTYFANIG